VTSPKRVRETKRYLRKAFRYQMDEVGFSLLEVLSPCPTYWRMSPMESCRYVEEAIAKVFPLGVVRDLEAGEDGSG
jgi:2-oxoglutarate ferredoxin oxidoreductase subunit beta